MSKLETNQVDPATGTTLTLGTSGDTIAIPSGVTIANSGTATGFAANTPAFLAKVGSSFTVAHNTTVVIPASNELIDTGSKYDTSTYRFTPTAGKYYLFAASTFQNFSNDKIAYLSLRKNGSGVMSLVNGTGVTDDMSNFIAFIESANGTDYFDATILQTSGGSQTATTSTYFGGYKIIE